MTVETVLSPQVGISQPRLADSRPNASPSANPYPALKRAVDRIIAAALLVALSPLLAAIAVGIKLHSPGPVLFKQDRVGLGGRTFKFYKFRSMRVDADSQVHREHVARLIRENVSPEDAARGGTLKLANDNRITGLGRILRRLSLDELPQLYNVLIGDMSLVGPRPCIPYEVECYQDWHHRRFEALPGCTGLWQVRGRNRVSFDDMVRMDIEYIESMSLGLDLRILLLTPWAMLTGRGAG